LQRIYVMALGRKPGIAGQRAKDTFSRLDALAKDKTRPVAFRIRTDQYHALELAAKRHGMSVGSYVRWIVARELDKDNESGGLHEQ